MVVRALNPNTWEAEPGGQTPTKDTQRKPCLGWEGRADEDLGDNLVKCLGVGCVADPQT